MTEDEEPFILDMISIDDWDETKTEKVRNLGVEIQRSTKDDTLSMLVRGERLLEFKLEVGHGNFEPLRKRNFSLSARDAQRCQAVAREFGVYKNQVKHMYLTDLQDIAQKDALKQIKESLLSRLERGTKPKREEYHSLIKDTIAAKTTKENAVELSLIDYKKASLDIEDDSPVQVNDAVEDDFQQVEIILYGMIPKDIREKKTLLDYLRNDGGPDKVVTFIVDRLEKLIEESPTHETESLHQRNSSQAFETAQHH